MRCPYCNTEINDYSRMCPHCRHTLAPRNVQPNAKQPRGGQVRTVPAGRLPGQRLDPVFIDEDVDTVVYTNPVANRRASAGNWVRPTIALAMALASVAVMGLAVQSSIAQIVHIGDTAGQTDAAATSSSAASSSAAEGDAESVAEQPIIEEKTDAAQSPPVFTAVEASSVLEGDSDAEHERYKAENAIDRSMATAWNEGSPGDGVGEWIEIKADRPQHVTGIRICGGFASDEGTYYNNGRPAVVNVTFDDQTSMEMQLEDLFAQYQTLNLEQPKDTTSIRVTITQIYSGYEYSDCCISEVQAF